MRLRTSSIDPSTQKIAVHRGLSRARGGKLPSDGAGTASWLPLQPRHRIGEAARCTMVTSLPSLGEVRLGMGAVHNRRARGAPQVFVNATSARDILIVVAVW